MQVAYQLIKTYGTGLRDYARKITKPVAGSLRVAVQGAEVTDFTVNTLTGVVTFGPAHVPALNAVVTAGFEFDVPVRFDTDQLKINLVSFAAGDIPDIPIVEVRA